MARETKAFCSWGMYAFTEVLQAAWISLYKSLIPELISYSELEEQLRFNTDEATLRDQNLFIGQTCGYPLIKCYQGILEPLCVPVFDVNGCDDTQYRSVIIVPKQSDYQSLEDCAGKTVIINGTDSNSGMNLLRAAVNPLREGNTYFGSTLLSGSHLASLQAVAAGRADIAAIDCVTFALISEATPILANRVRVIGYTEPTYRIAICCADSPGEKSQCRNSNQSI